MSPSTVICCSASGAVAGPVTTEPSAIENALPWHSQLMLPSATALTDAALVGADGGEALELALGGLGDDDLSSAKIVPPPTSMSAVCAKASAPPADSLGLARRLRCRLARRSAVLLGVGVFGSVGVVAAVGAAARREDGQPDADRRDAGDGAGGGGGG